MADACLACPLAPFRGAISESHPYRRFARRDRERGEQRSLVKPYFALAGLALIWGASFLLIKVAVHDRSPTVLLLIRSVSGLIALAVIVKAMGRPILGDGWKTRLGSFPIMPVPTAI